jgi:4-hydroxy-3-methylbut-2-enyl diphosphate reductase
MEIIRADTAGFCMGVSLALRKLDEVLEQGGAGPIFTLGPIIHNPQVLAAYEARGVSIAETPDDIPEGARVLIRAHGIPRHVEDALNSRGATVVDATCPKVKKAQLLIARQAEQGRRLLLFGEEDHPEVKGLRSYAQDKAYVFHALDQLKEHLACCQEPHFLAAQTTQDRQAFEEVVDFLLDRCGPDMPVLETICDATMERQQEALEIAQQVDAMVVVGGFSSGNTRRLVDVVAGQGIYCVHVEVPEELPLDQLRERARIGLTAGASTPKTIIDAVHERLERL